MNIIPGTFLALAVSASVLANEIKPFDFTNSDTPSSTELLDIWRYQNQNIVKGKGEKVEVKDFQIKVGKPEHGVSGMAFIRFAPLGDDGKAETWNGLNCKGEKLTDAGIQIYFQRDAKSRRWGTGGTVGSSICSTNEQESQSEIAKQLENAPYPTPPKISKADVTEPAKGSPDRKAILDVIREKYVNEASKIEFQVKTMKMAAGFAWVVVVPQYKNGKLVGCVEGDDLQSEYWMKKVEGKWTIAGGNGACSGDPSIQTGEQIGAPPQIVGKEKWPYFDEDAPK